MYIACILLVRGKTRKKKNLMRHVKDRGLRYGAYFGRGKGRCQAYLKEMAYGKCNGSRDTTYAEAGNELWSDYGRY